MKPRSEYLMWLYTMSRWRLFTGTSTGSQIVPPEWCSQGDDWASFTRLRKSSIVP